jgi:UDP-glucose 4-epimerase
MYYNLYGLKTITLRYFNVYGNRQPLRGEYAPVVGLFLRQAAANSPMTIVGDGSQTRDFTSVLDVVEANMLATRVDIPEAFGEVYNIGTGKRYSIIDVARMIGTEWIHIDGRPGEATDSLADISKSRRVLGYNPTSSLKQWIHEEITAPTQ